MTLFVCVCAIMFIVSKFNGYQILSMIRTMTVISSFDCSVGLNRVPNLYHTFHKCNIVHIITSMFSFTSKRIRSLLKRNLNLNDNCGIDLTRFIHDYCIWIISFKRRENVVWTVDFPFLVVFVIVIDRMIDALVVI